MAISEDPWQSCTPNNTERLAVEAVITYFYELDLSWLGFKHPTGGDRSKNQPRHRHGSFSFEIIFSNN